MQNRNHVLWNFHCWHNPSPLTYTFSRERKIFLSSSPLSHWWRYFIFISQYTVACISVESPKSVYFDCRGWVSFQRCSLQLFSWTLLLLSRYVSHFQLLFSKGKQTHKTLFGSKWERKGSLKSYAFLLFLLHIFLVTKQSVIYLFAAGTDMRVGWKLRLRFALRNVPRERKRSAQMHAYKACEPYFKGPYACFFFGFFFFVSLILCLFDMILNLLWSIR